MSERKKKPKAAAELPPIQEYSTLGISNDFMFGHVMSDPKLCKAFLEELLGFKIEKIKIIERQKTIDEKLGSHAVRLDIYAENTEDMFNCEMEARLRKYGYPKRSRYYQSHIDVNHLKPGESYDSLKRSFVIFICAFDPFGKDRYIYTFENMCREEPGLRLGDDTYKIFINTKGHVGKISKTMKEIIHFFNTSEIKEYESPLVNDMVKGLQNARSSKKWRKDYMSLEMLKNECRFEGREEGRAQGREEGLAEGEKKGRAEGEKKGRAEGEKKGRAEGEKKGRAEGEKKGRDEMLYNLVCHGDLTVKRAAEIAGSTQTAFRANMLKAGFAMP